MDRFGPETEARGCIWCMCSCMLAGGSGHCRADNETGNTATTLVIHWMVAFTRSWQCRAILLPWTPPTASGGERYRLDARREQCVLSQGW